MPHPSPAPSRSRRGTHRTAETLRAHFGNEAFTAEQAHRCLVSQRQLEQAARSGAITRLRRGVYVVTTDRFAQHLGLLRVTAERLAIDGVAPIAIASSAAALLAVDIPNSPAIANSPAIPRAMLAIPTTSTRHAGLRNGVLLRKWDVPDHHVAEYLPGLKITNPLRTAADVVRESRLARPFAAAVLCLFFRRQLEWSHAGARRTDDHDLDHDLAERPASELPLPHRRLTDRALHRIAGDEARRAAVRAEFAALLAELPSRGRSHLVAVMEHADPRPENLFEALSWARMSMADIPLPTCQVWLQGASGSWYRADFYWERWGLIGEADGAMKYRSATDVMKEKHRQADLEDAGYTFARWAWDDVTPGSDKLITRLRTRLR